MLKFEALYLNAAGLSLLFYELDSIKKTLKNGLLLGEVSW